MSDEIALQISQVEDRIRDLTQQIDSARSDVSSWTDAGKNLSQQAATERAKNQGAGRGFLGGLLGSKYRAAVRAGAAASNASIAQEVAKRRAAISDGKRAAQEEVRALQDDLRDAKNELRDLKSELKSSTTGKTSRIKSAHSSLDLLTKLKAAHDAGLLSDSEYEQKRFKLIDQL